jgi:hypothetical protein
MPAKLSFARVRPEKGAISNARLSAPRRRMGDEASFFTCRRKRSSDFFGGQMPLLKR